MTNLPHVTAAALAHKTKYIVTNGLRECCFLVGPGVLDQKLGRSKSNARHAARAASRERSMDTPRSDQAQSSAVSSRAASPPLPHGAHYRPASGSRRRIPHHDSHDPPAHEPAAQAKPETDMLDHDTRAQYASAMLHDARHGWQSVQPFTRQQSADGRQPSPQLAEDDWPTADSSPAVAGQSQDLDRHQTAAVALLAQLLQSAMRSSQDQQTAQQSDSQPAGRPYSGAAHQEGWHSSPSFRGSYAGSVQSHAAGQSTHQHLSAKPAPKHHGRSDNTAQDTCAAPPTAQQPPAVHDSLSGPGIPSLWASSSPPQQAASRQPLAQALLSPQQAQAAPSVRQLRPGRSLQPAEPVPTAPDDMLRSAEDAQDDAAADNMPRATPPQQQYQQLQWQHASNLKLPSVQARRQLSSIGPPGCWQQCPELLAAWLSLKYCTYSGLLLLLLLSLSLNVCYQKISRNDAASVWKHALYICRGCRGPCTSQAAGSSAEQCRKSLTSMQKLNCQLRMSLRVAVLHSLGGC